MAARTIFFARTLALYICMERVIVATAVCAGIFVEL